MEYLLMLVLAGGVGLAAGGEDASTLLPDRPEGTPYLDMLLASPGGGADPELEVQDPFSQLPEGLGIYLGGAAPAQDRNRFYRRYPVDRFELIPLLGMLMYSADWEADPSMSYGVRGLLPLHKVMERFGVFVQITSSQLDRDIATLANKDDKALYMTLGVDYTFIEEQAYRVHAQGGLLHGNFGSVSDVGDGISFILGVSGSMRLSKSLWVSYNPQLALADDSQWLFFHHLGLSIGF